MPDIVSPSAFNGESFSLSEPGGACLANSLEIENLRHVDECESDAECDAVAGGDWGGEWKRGWWRS